MSGATNGHSKSMTSEQIDQIQMLPPHDSNHRRFESTGAFGVRTKDNLVEVGDSSKQNSVAGDSIAGAEALEQLRAAPNVVSEPHNSILHSANNGTFSNHTASKLAPQDNTSLPGSFLEFSSDNDDNSVSSASRSVSNFDQNVLAPASHLFNGSGGYVEGLGTFNGSKL